MTRVLDGGSSCLMPHGLGLLLIWGETLLMRESDDIRILDSMGPFVETTLQLVMAIDV